MQSLSFGSEAFPSSKGILYRKALRTVSDRSRRACADCFRSRLRRLGFASPLGRDPSRTRSDYHDVESRPVKSETSHLHKTGTSHFALTHPSLALSLASESVRFC
jgi:hypothetical protein